MAQARLAWLVETAIDAKVARARDAWAARQATRLARPVLAARAKDWRLVELAAAGEHLLVAPTA